MTRTDTTALSAARIFTATLLMALTFGACVEPPAEEAELYIEIEAAYEDRVVVLDRSVVGERFSLESAAIDRAELLQGSLTEPLNVSERPTETVRVAVWLDDERVFEREVDFEAFFAERSEMLSAVTEYADTVEREVSKASATDAPQGIDRDRGSREYCYWQAGQQHRPVEERVYAGCVWFLTGDIESP